MLAPKEAPAFPHAQPHQGQRPEARGCSPTWARTRGAMTSSHAAGLGKGAGLRLRASLLGSLAGTLAMLRKG